MVVDQWASPASEVFGGPWLFFCLYLRNENAVVIKGTGTAVVKGRRDKHAEKLGTLMDKSQTKFADATVIS